MLCLSLSVWGKWLSVHLVTCEQLASVDGPFLKLLNKLNTSVILSDKLNPIALPDLLFWLPWEQNWKIKALSDLQMFKTLIATSFYSNCLDWEIKCRCSKKVQLAAYSPDPHTLDIGESLEWRVRTVVLYVIRSVWRLHGSILDRKSLSENDAYRTWPAS